MTTPLLDVRDLHVAVDGAAVLRGLTLRVRSGEVHAIMGPNGSGKSTFGFALAGKEGYRTTSGSATLGGEDLSPMAPEERAGRGLFLAFQHPLEIPGVSNMTFLRTSLNALRRRRGTKELDPAAFLREVRKFAVALGISDAVLKRELNVGFSGGEKKRNEILQMMLCEPTLAVLDEPDSGLDVDSMKAVGQGVNAMRAPDRGIVIVTHYRRLLDVVPPDVVHVMAGGRIVRSGGPELAAEIEKSGYAPYTRSCDDESGPKGVVA